MVISFSSASYDPDGSISHVLWDFGDGTPSTQNNDSHTYNKAGDYRVTLVVWDDMGRGHIAGKNITIRKRK